MKLSNLKLLFILALAPALFSCNSTPEHAKYIPNNSLMVQSFNLQQMVMKAEPTLIMKMDIFQEIVRDLKNDANKDQRKLIDDFLDNPLVSGIDFLEPMYTFMNSANDDEFRYYCVAMVLASEGSFKEAMISIMDGQPQEGDGFTYIEADEMCVGWANNVGIIAMNVSNDEVDPVTYLSELFNADQTQSYVDNDERFAQFITAEHDIGFYGNWSYGVIWYESLFALADIFSDFIDMGEFVTDLSRFENNYTEFGLTFNNNDISVQMKNHFNAEMAEKLNITDVGVPNEYMASLTDEELISAFSLSVDMEKLNDFAKGLPGYGELSDEFSRNLGFGFDEMTSVFTGDMIHSLVGVKLVEMEVDPYDFGYAAEAVEAYGIDEYLEGFAGSSEPELVEQPMPIFISTVGVNNTETITEMLAEEGKEQGGIYTIDQFIYVTFYDNRMFVTNDFGYAQDLRQSGSIGNYNNSEVTQLFTENAVGGYINLDIASWDEQTREMMQEEFGLYYMMAEGFSQELVDARMHGSFTSMGAELTFKDGEYNTLYRIIEATGSTGF